MKKIIAEIKNNVNLEGYATSDGFLGFFENYLPYKFGFEQNIVQHFINSFSSVFQSGYLISSLFADADALDNLVTPEDKAETLSYIKYFDKTELLPIYDYTPSLEETEKKISERMNLDNYYICKLSDMDISQISMLAKAKLSCSGLYGHLFFYIECYKTVIYIGDDFGFGAINIGDDKYDFFGINYLLSINKVHGFTSHLERTRLPLK